MQVTAYSGTGTIGSFLGLILEGTKEAACCYKAARHPVTLEAVRNPVAICRSVDAEAINSLIEAKGSRWSPVMCTLSVLVVTVCQREGHGCPTQRTSKLTSLRMTRATMIHDAACLATLPAASLAAGGSAGPRTLILTEWPDLCLLLLSTSREVIKMSFTFAGDSSLFPAIRYDDIAIHPPSRFTLISSPDVERKALLRCISWLQDQIGIYKRFSLVQLYRTRIVRQASTCWTQLGPFSQLCYSPENPLGVHGCQALPVVDLLPQTSLSTGMWS